MLPAKRHIIALTLCLLAINLPAQNITGTWEGDLENDQFMQLNIIQTGNKICGYTYDHVNKDQRSYCKAFFEGYFDKKTQKLVISGKFFLENSGDHFLMNISFDYFKTKKGVEMLEVKPTARSVLSSVLTPFGIVIEPEPFEDGSNVQYASLKKVSDQPYELIDLMKDCIAADKKKPDTVAKIIVPKKRKDSTIVKTVPPKPKNNTPPVVKTVPPKPKNTTPPVVKTVPPKPKSNTPPIAKTIPPKKKDSMPAMVKIPPPKKKDSLPAITPPVIVKKETPPLPKTFTQRKNTEQSRITVDVKSINLKVYDNAIVDGDTVSIIYNGKLLLSHKLLSEKGIEINLELDDNQTRHEIILFAENLGSIPPNTALVVITAGQKRYELFASASLEENAVLVFDYRPPK